MAEGGIGARALRRIAPARELIVQASGGGVGDSEETPAVDDVPPPVDDGVSSAEGDEDVVPEEEGGSVDVVTVSGLGRADLLPAEPGQYMWSKVRVVTPSANFTVEASRSVAGLQKVVRTTH